MVPPFRATAQISTRTRMFRYRSARARPSRGTDTDLLHEEGIGQTDAFVAITGIDEANILMSMCASKAGPGRR